MKINTQKAHELKVNHTKTHCDGIVHRQRQRKNLKVAI
jgi:hypothetical protein